MSDVYQALLDSRPGTIVWLLQLRPGDARAIYPVYFMGFAEVQPAGNLVIISNPFLEGYSMKVQDEKCRFRKAYLLKTVSAGFIHLSCMDACLTLIRDLLDMGFRESGICDFLRITVKRCKGTRDHFIRRAAVKLNELIRYEMNSDPYHETFQKMMMGEFA